MARSNRFSPEVRDRAVRMVLEHQASTRPPSAWPCVAHQA